MFKPRANMDLRTSRPTFVLSQKKLFFFIYENCFKFLCEKCCWLKISFDCRRNTEHFTSICCCGFCWLSSACTNMCRRMLGWIFCHRNHFTWASYICKIMSRRHSKWSSSISSSATTSMDLCPLRRAGWLKAGHSKVILVSWSKLNPSLRLLCRNPSAHSTRGQSIAQSCSW